MENENTTIETTAAVQEFKAALEKSIAELTEMGMPIDASNFAEFGLPTLRGQVGEKISVSTHWWGIDFKMNQKMTQSVIDGAIAVKSLGGAFASALGAAGVVSGGIAAVIGAAFAAAIALKVAQVKITNNGKGVSWPVTHFQWAAVLAAVPLGPSGVTAAMMIWIHPVRN